MLGSFSQHQRETPENQLLNFLGRRAQKKHLNQKRLVREDKLKLLFFFLLWTFYEKDFPQRPDTGGEDEVVQGRVIQYNWTELTAEWQHL